ncbi:MAG: YhgE/Pip family protein [Corynebacterium sp.]|uniref:YhgE/Pip family protein n=1 Tax=Corynebacterium sp. TaxID=1720 RepID=UPI0026DAE080|nr:YhgE/Pip domain-containing protein [Corynebacterium sp.]MDO4761084.1 YhgE/Pip family protein [Corynebacterium sp.]
MNEGTDCSSHLSASRSFSWKRLTAIIFLLFPMIVSVVYMWAMWDPGKSLRSVNLALVNNDAGVMRDGKLERHADKVVEGLLSRDYLSFKEVDAATAQAGLDKGDFLFTVTLPETFSENLTSVLSEKPTTPEVIISYNDFNGTNGSVLTGGLVPRLQQAVSSSISETYATKIIDGMNNLGGGISRAADGSLKLADGAGRLKDGLAQANSGATQLSEGTAKLSSGTQQLADGAARLAQGTARLGDGAAQIDEGVGKLTDTLIPVLTTAQNAAPQLQGIADGLRAAGLVTEANRIADLANKFDASNPNNQVEQLKKLKNGTATMRHMLSDPNSEYYGGVLKLKDGIERANEGAGKLNDGAGKLSAGTQKLHDGSVTIKDGLDQLHEKLAAGAAKAPNAADVGASAKQVAVPIAYKENNANPVQTIIDIKDPTEKQLSSGASMLIIMVFGFLLMAMIAILVPHVFGTDRRTAFVGPTLKSFAGLVVTGSIIVSVLAASAHVAGWAPKSWPAIVLAFAVMVSAASACNQMLRALFGRFTGGIAILALFSFGLFSFGGVWPLATVPKPFQLIHPFSPMSYAREAFVSATRGDLGSSYVGAVIVLALFTVVPLAITLMVRNARVKKIRQLSGVSA